VGKAGDGLRTGELARLGPVCVTIVTDVDHRVGGIGEQVLVEIEVTVSPTDDQVYVPVVVQVARGRSRHRAHVDVPLDLEVLGPLRARRRSRVLVVTDGPVVVAYEDVVVAIAVEVGHCRARVSVGLDAGEEAGSGPDPGPGGILVLVRRYPHVGLVAGRGVPAVGHVEVVVIVHVGKIGGGVESLVDAVEHRAGTRPVVGPGGCRIGPGVPVHPDLSHPLSHDQVVVAVVVQVDEAWSPLVEVEVVGDTHDGSVLLPLGGGLGPGVLEVEDPSDPAAVHITPS
jgi:hypothetical protein